MRDRIRRTIARHIRHLLEAAFTAPANRRDVCSECRCPVRDIQLHYYIDHAGDPGVTP